MLYRQGLRQKKYRIEIDRFYKFQTKTCLDNIYLEVYMRLKASAEGLNRINSARKRWSDAQWCREASMIMEPNKNWETDDFIANDIFAANCSVGTLKNFLAGKPIYDLSFEIFCQVVGLDWREIVDSSGSIQLQEQSENTSFIESFWVGRNALITKLSAKLQETCRVLVLTGITGIGKTALAYQLAKALEIKGFARERSLNFDEFSSPNFVSVAAYLLNRWGEPVTVNDRKNTEQLTDRLLQKFQNHPYLIQIDSLENLLDGDETTGWNNFQDNSWVDFFRKLIALPDCQSRFIVTSQEIPSQFQEIGNPKIHDCEPLKGLEPLERLELFVEIFARREIEVDLMSSDRFLLERIGSAYEGHPLALLVIAGEILTDDFSGDISAYWKKYGHEIEEVEKMRQKEQIESENERLKLDRFTRRLKDEVKKRVENSFQRLKENLPDAYELLCKGSVYRLSLPSQAWFKGLIEHFGYTERRLLVAMDSLEDRYLVEVEGFIGEKKLFRQHNLIRSVALVHNKKITKRSMIVGEKDGKQLS
jgi:hypothetical protein